MYVSIPSDDNAENLVKAQTSRSRTLVLPLVLLFVLIGLASTKTLMNKEANEAELSLGEIMALRSEPSESREVRVSKVIPANVKSTCHAQYLEAIAHPLTIPPLDRYPQCEQLDVSTIVGGSDGSASTKGAVHVYSSEGTVLKIGLLGKMEVQGQALAYNILQDFNWAVQTGGVITKGLKAPAILPKVFAQECADQLQTPTAPDEFEGLACYMQLMPNFMDLNQLQQAYPISGTGLEEWNTKKAALASNPKWGKFEAYLDLFYRLTYGMRVLEQHGVYHNDIHGGNFGISAQKDWEAWILDFGFFSYGRRKCGRFLEKSVCEAMAPAQQRKFYEDETLNLRKEFITRKYLAMVQGENYVADSCKCAGPSFGDQGLCIKGKCKSFCGQFQKPDFSDSDLYQIASGKDLEEITCPPIPPAAQACNLGFKVGGASKTGSATTTLPLTLKVGDADCVVIIEYNCPASAGGKFVCKATKVQGTCQGITQGADLEFSTNPHAFIYPCEEVITAF